ncbi:MAG: polysaccharide deacetylase family protein [Longimicrobiales bacterium]
MRRRLGRSAWGVGAALVLAISIGITLRQLALVAARPARFSGALIVRDMPSLLASTRLPRAVRVVVVRDEAAASFHDSPAVLDSIVDAWRDALAATGADARIVASSGLARAPRPDVLVVPAAPCLSIATREALDRAGSRGQGLIISGAPGTHDAGCRAIGFGLLVAMTGASRAAVLDDPPMVYVTIPNGGLLGADVPPGARIDVDPGGQIALRGTGREGVYTRYDLRPAPAADSPLLDGALARAVYRGAPVAWWGFEPHRVLDRPWDRAVMRLLVRNSLAWAARIPLATIEPWPGDHHAAVVIAQDVESGFANARFAADSLRAIGLPSTFFLTSRLALRNRRVARTLLRSGEVGSHSEDHRLLGGTPVAEQQARLRATQRDLAEITGGSVAGLRPPEEQFDRGTFEAWIAAGGRYVLGSNGSRSAAPELLAIGDDTLTLLPRTGLDDLAAIQKAGNDPGIAEALLDEEFRHIRGLGGLYAFSYHSQLLSRSEHVPVVARLARTFAADPTVWVATAGDVAAWWRARATLAIEVRARGGHRLELVVRNPGGDSVRDAVARVMLPAGRRAAVDGRLESPPDVVRVLLPALGPGEARTVTISLDG